MSYEVTFADGYVWRGGASSDGVEYLNLSSQLSRGRASIIAPGASYTFDTLSWSSGRSDRDIASVGAAPTFVIFDDDRGLGDEREIRRNFKNRADNYRAWRVIDRIFADAVAHHPNPHDVLVAAQTALESMTDDTIKRSQAFLWIHLLLSSNLKFTRPDDTPLLNSTLETIHVRRATNEAHYVRRK